MQGFLLRVDLAEIVIEEADEASAVVGFADAALAGAQGADVDPLAVRAEMRPKAVTGSARSCSGSAISGRRAPGAGVGY
jgi:hypothetical protein